MAPLELSELPATARIELAEGGVTVYPTLVERDAALWLAYEWTAAEASRAWHAGAVRLARAMLPAQAKDLARRIAADTQLVLAASPYLHGAQLADVLLQRVFGCACFGDVDAPRTRPAFEHAVEQGRGSLHEVFAEITRCAQKLV